MTEHRVPNWRAWVAAGFLALVLFLVIDNWPRAPVEPPAADAGEKVPPAPSAPAPLGPLDRAALLDAVALAASAQVTGEATDATMPQLKGRRFELILPFGCDGPEPGDRELQKGWRYDASTEIFQAAYPSNIQISPDEDTATTASEPVARFAKSFWIERDWLREGVCVSHQVPADSDGSTPPKTLAIAELAIDKAPRADDREGAPYRLSKRLPPQQVPMAQEGLRLVIAGKLANNGDNPIQCKSVDPNQRPTCVILADIDRVAITDAGGVQVFGEWDE